MPRPAFVMDGNTSTATAWSASCLVAGWMWLRLSSAVRALLTSSVWVAPLETDAEAGPPVLELLFMPWQPARPRPAQSPPTTSDRREIEVIILPPPVELRGQGWPSGS